MMKVKKSKIAIRKKMLVTANNVFTLTYLRTSHALNGPRHRGMLRHLNRYHDSDKGLFLLTLDSALRFHSERRTARQNDILFPAEMAPCLFNPNIVAKLKDAVARLEDETRNEASTLVEIDIPLLEFKKMRGEGTTRALAYNLCVSNFHKINAITSNFFSEDETVDLSAQIVLQESAPSNPKFSEARPAIISTFTTTLTDMFQIVQDEAFTQLACKGGTDEEVDSLEEESCRLRDVGPSERTVMILGNESWNLERSESVAHE